MHVNLLVHCIAFEEERTTDIQVVANVHDDKEVIGSIQLYNSHRAETIPTEETNLNLWATALLRGIAAGMEERFLWTDQRPEAILIKNAIERKQILGVGIGRLPPAPATIDPAELPKALLGRVLSLSSTCERE